MPRFTIAALISADTGLGASGWARGSQACSGTRPALDPKPTSVARTPPSAVAGDSRGQAGEPVASRPPPTAPAARPASRRNPTGSARHRTTPAARTSAAGARPARAAARPAPSTPTPPGTSSPSPRPAPAASSPRRSATPTARTRQVRAARVANRVDPDGNRDRPGHCDEEPAQRVERQPHADQRHQPADPNGSRSGEHRGDPDAPPATPEPGGEEPGQRDAAGPLRSAVGSRSVGARRRGWWSPAGHRSQRIDDLRGRGGHPGTSTSTGITSPTAPQPRMRRRTRHSCGHSRPRRSPPAGGGWPRTCCATAAPCCGSRPR